MTAHPQLDELLAEMVEKERIREVIARFARGIDRNDVEMVRSCFHPDGTFDHGRLSQGSVEGFLTQMESWPFLWTQHHLAQTMYELHGDVAFTETYCMAYHRWPADGTSPERDMTIGLRYLDRFEKREGDWKIVHRVLGWDWNRIDVGVKTTDPGPEMVQGKRNKDDMVYRLNQI